MRPLDGVRELRERRMLSQQELADRAGVSLFTVQRIERGEGAVRPKTGRAVAAALGVGVEVLLPKAQATLPFDDEPSLEELHAEAGCASTWLVMPEAEWRAAWSPDLSPRGAMSIVHEMTAEISALKPLMDKQEHGLPWSRRVFSGHFRKAWWRYFDGLERAKARGEAAGLIGPEGTPKDLAKMLGQEPGKSLDELLLAAS